MIGIAKSGFALITQCRRRVYQWHSRRFLRRKEPFLSLGMRRIYLKPETFAAAFVLTFFVMLFASINYGLNTGFLFSFVVISYGMVSAIFVFGNIFRLRLTSKPELILGVFAGDMATLSLAITNPTKKIRCAVEVSLHDELIETPSVVVNIPPKSTLPVEIDLQTTQRGKMSAPLLRVHTSFPFGLFRAWSYWNCGIDLIVYPAPEKLENSELPFCYTEGVDQAEKQSKGSEDSDFAGVRPYRTGDSKRHLAWRNIARADALTTGVLFSKQYDSNITQNERTFAIDLLPESLSLEQKLSRLVRLILDAEQAGAAYCLSLPGNRIGPSFGEHHRATCLSALALYQPSQPTV